MISVIVPMFNSYSTIERCLRSIMGQTYHDMEIIVIDDGSTDNSGRIVEKIAQEDSRIRYIRQENGGVSRARNHGIEVSVGEYISFVDSDDAIDANYIADMYNMLKDKGSDIVFCGYCEVGQNSRKEHRLSEEEMKQLQGDIKTDFYQLKEFAGSPCMKLYSSPKIKKHHLLFQENMVTAEDQHFNFQYFEYCSSVAFVNRSNYLYYVSESTLSVKRTRKCFESELVNLSYGKSFMEKYSIKNGLLFIAESLCYCSRRYVFLEGEKNTISECKTRLKKLYEIIHLPIHLPNWKDNIIYQLLRRRFCFILYLYLFFRLRVLSRLK